MDNINYCIEDFFFYYKSTIYFLVISKKTLYFDVI